MALIILIEDEKDIRDDVAEELRDVGHEVVTAENGNKGLKHILFRKPDLILCDVVMNGMMGCEIIKTLHKDHPDLTHIPFIFISALAGEQNIKDAFCLGASDYITKPIDFDKLIKSVNSHLEKSPLFQAGGQTNPKMNTRQRGSLPYG